MGNPPDPAPARLRLLCVSSHVLGHRTYSSELRSALDRCGDIAEVFHVSIGAPEYERYSARRARLLGSVAEAEFVSRRAVAESGVRDFDAAILVGWEFLTALGPAIGRRPTLVITDITPKLLGQAGQDAKPRSAAVRATRSVVRSLADARFRRQARHALFLPMSDWCAKSLRDDYGAALADGGAAPCPLDLDVWRPGEPGVDGKLRLLFVGNDLDRKGGYRLIRIFDEHLRGFATLTIATGDRSIAKFTVPVGVSIVSGKTRDELVPVYQRADLLVMPTTREPLGHVFGEAAACGVPSVATDVGGVHSLVHNGLTGYLIKPGAPDRGWVDVISDLATNRKRLEALKLAARRMAEAALDVRHFQARVRTIVESLG